MICKIFLTVFFVFNIHFLFAESTALKSFMMLSPKSQFESFSVSELERIDKLLSGIPLFLSLEGEVFSFELEDGFIDETFTIRVFHHLDEAKKQVGYVDVMNNSKITSSFFPHLFNDKVFGLFVGFEYRNHYNWQAYGFKGIGRSLLCLSMLVAKYRGTRLFEVIAEEDVVKFYEKNGFQKAFDDPNETKVMVFDLTQAVLPEFGIELSSHVNFLLSSIEKAS